MTSNFSNLRRLLQGTVLGVGLGVLLVACGGADGGADVAASVQVRSPAERAALDRAKAINRDAMGRIDGERADRSVTTTQ